MQGKLFFELQLGLDHGVRLEAKYGIQFGTKLAT